MLKPLTIFATQLAVHTKYTSTVRGGEREREALSGQESRPVVAVKLTCQHKDLHRLRMGRSAANVDRGCRVEAAAQMDNSSSG